MPKRFAANAALVVPLCLLFIGCGKNYDSVSLGAVQDGALTVDAVHLQQRGFVAIYQSVNGQPGPLVGQSAVLEAGETDDLKVPFTSAQGQTYIAMLRSDDNGDGKLEEGTDQPITDENGTTVMETFEVQAAPSAPAPAPAPAAAVEDSLILGGTSGGMLTVKSATLSKPGFVAVYLSLGGAPGPLVGKSALLKAGTTTDFTAPFTVSPGKAYFAMLRSDDDGNGSLDENLDNPVNDAHGATVMQAFTLK